MARVAPFAPTFYQHVLNILVCVVAATTVGYLIQYLGIIGKIPFSELALYIAIFSLGITFVGNYIFGTGMYYGAVILLFISFKTQGSDVEAQLFAYLLISVALATEIRFQIYRVSLPEENADIAVIKDDQPTEAEVSSQSLVLKGGNKMELNDEIISLNSAQTWAALKGIPVGAIFGGFGATLIFPDDWFLFSTLTLFGALCALLFINLVTYFSFLRPLTIFLVIAFPVYIYYSEGISASGTAFIFSALVTVCMIFLGLEESKVATGKWSDFWRSLLLEPDGWKSVMGIRTFEHTLPPLHVAAKRGELSRVRSILEEGGDSNSLYDSVAPIHVAAAYGSEEIVALLLNFGVSIESKSGNGNTPLISAASTKEHRIVEMLIDNGANINASNKEGQTALAFAAYIGDIKLAKLLKDRSADLTAKAQSEALPKDITMESRHQDLGGRLDTISHQEEKKVSSQSKSNNVYILCLRCEESINLTRRPYKYYCVECNNFFHARCCDEPGCCPRCGLMHCEKIKNITNKVLNRLEIENIKFQNELAKTDFYESKCSSDKIGTLNDNDKQSIEKYSDRLIENYKRKSFLTGIFCMMIAPICIYGAFWFFVHSNFSNLGRILSFFAIFGFGLGGFYLGFIELKAVSNIKNTSLPAQVAKSFYYEVLYADIPNIYRILQSLDYSMIYELKENTKDNVNDDDPIGELIRTFWYEMRSKCDQLLGSQEIPFFNRVYTKYNEEEDIVEAQIDIKKIHYTSDDRKVIKKCIVIEFKSFLREDKGGWRITSVFPNYPSEK